ncbi:hypothetical protein QYG89_07855 [Bacillus sp. B190/17]|uniref:Lipoprotein n=1 Tax=Bacillus lumedeiriae TaxID=3058829 RepID=A0ABW8IAA1_9BACI
MKKRLLYFAGSSALAAMLLMGCGNNNGPADDTDENPIKEDQQDVNDDANDVKNDAENDMNDAENNVEDDLHGADEDMTDDRNVVEDENPPLEQQKDMQRDDNKKNE